MRRWSLLLAGAAAVVGMTAATRDCAQAGESAPFAGRLPEDAVLYVGTADAEALVARLRALPVAEAESWRAFREATGFDAIAQQAAELRGPAAAVARPGPGGRLEWTVIIRGGLPGVGSGEHGGWKYRADSGRLLLARSVETIDRFLAAPPAPLHVAYEGGDAAFWLRPSAFPHEAWSAWWARWRDISSMSGRVDASTGLRVRALAKWSAYAWREALEDFVQAPPRARAPEGVIAWTCQMESFGRVWSELRDGEDGKIVERGGREVRERIGRAGPVWAAAVTPDGTTWAAVEAREEGLESTARRALRAYGDAVERRGNGSALTANGLVDRRLRWWHRELRSEAGRLVFGGAPALWGEGTHHLGTVIDLQALSRIEGALGPFAADAETCGRWLGRLVWGGRFEAWTTFTDRGAVVEAAFSMGRGDGGETR